ncbi:hypothetical protein GCM10027049_22780 [Mucilaginibacter puniceus]
MIKEALTYSLAIHDLATFSRGSVDIMALFHNFFAPGSNHYQQLAYELQREFKQGGSPEVTAIGFDRVQYNAQTHKGSFRIVLDINFTFGCEDLITEKQGETSEWTYAVDMHANTIQFYNSPFAESRSTADEF